MSFLEIAQICWGWGSSDLTGPRLQVGVTGNMCCCIPMGIPLWHSHQGYQFITATRQTKTSGIHVLVSACAGVRVPGKEGKTHPLMCIRTRKLVKWWGITDIRAHQDVVCDDPSAVHVGHKLFNFIWKERGSWLEHQKKMKNAKQERNTERIGDLCSKTLWLCLVTSQRCPWISADHYQEPCCASSTCFSFSVLSLWLFGSAPKK